MKHINAIIRWNTATNGERIRNLPVGSVYFPVIFIPDRMVDGMWSVRFIITEANSMNESNIVLTMLVDNLDSRAFSQKLNAGIHFLLFEGNVVVASGVVI